MDWFDVAMILFICVAMNHLGLINAIEQVIKKELPIINCCKCASFWFTLIYLLLTCNNIIVSIATSFLCSALAPWVNLVMGYFDTKFNSFYDKIFSIAENEHSEAGSYEDDPTISVS